MAQSQGRLVGRGNNSVVASLKKRLLVYVGLPFMLCLGSCDNPKHAPQSDALYERVDTDIESQPEMVAANGYWVMRKGSNAVGVYDGLPDWVGNAPSRKRIALSNLTISDDILRIYDADSYQLVKLHDETGKIIPESLRRGLKIIYKSKDDGGGHGFDTIVDIFDEVVRINHSVEIDTSQVVGVRIIHDPQQNKPVIFSPPAHMLPYLYGAMLHAAMTDSREINTNEDIYLLGHISSRYTHGDIIVRLRKDLYYTRQDGDKKHVFTEREESAYAIPYSGLFLLEQGSFIMKEDAYIVYE